MLAHNIIAIIISEDKVTADAAILSKLKAFGQMRWDQWLLISPVEVVLGVLTCISESLAHLKQQLLRLGLLILLSVIERGQGLVLLDLHSQSDHILLILPRGCRNPIANVLIGLIGVLLIFFVNGILEVALLASLVLPRPLFLLVLLRLVHHELRRDAALHRLTQSDHVIAHDCAFSFVLVGLDFCLKHLNLWLWFSRGRIHIVIFRVRVLLAFVVSINFCLPQLFEVFMEVLELFSFIEVHDWIAICVASDGDAADSFVELIVLGSSDHLHG